MAQKRVNKSKKISNGSKKTLGTKKVKARTKKSIKKSHSTTKRRHQKATTKQSKEKKRSKEKKNEKRILSNLKFDNKLPIRILGALLVLLLIFVGIVSIGPILEDSVNKTSIVLYKEHGNPESAYLENLLIQTSNRFKGQLDIEIVHIFDSNYTEAALKELCAAEVDKDLGLRYIYCNNYRTLTEVTGSCKNILENVENERKFKDCMNKYPDRVLAKNNAKIIEGNYPILMIDGTEFTTSISEDSISRAICVSLESPPEICSILPECKTDFDCPPKSGMIAFCNNAVTSNSSCEYSPSIQIPLTIITCSKCNTTEISRIMRYEFGDLDIKTYDVNSKIGRALIAKQGIEFVPAYLFGKEIKEHKRFYRIKDNLIDKTDYFLLEQRSSGVTYKIERFE